MLPCEAYSYRRDSAVPSFPDDKPIIIFDGKCVLCSGFARFVLTHDRRRRFRLLPAQTPLGTALFPWSLVGAWRVMPLGWRDAMYNLIARNRLRWFGTRDICMLSVPGHDDRFLA